MNSSKMVADPTSLWGRAQVHPWPELSRTLRLGKAIHPPGPPEHFQGSSYSLPTVAFASILKL